MRHETFFQASRDGAARLLTVPGLCSSGPEHWQSLWEAERADTTRIALPDCDDPHPACWIDAIEEAVTRVDGPLVLVAHSLGCHAVVGWAQTASRRALRAIEGALLVAPPDTCREALDPRIRRFASASTARLPFPGLLVASRDDPYAAIAASGRMAREWAVDLIDAGDRGHLNADSGLANWSDGQRLAERLARRPPDEIPTRIERPENEGRMQGHDVTRSGAIGMTAANVRFRGYR